MVCRVVRFVIVAAALAFVADGVALGQPTSAARPSAKAPEAPQKRVSAVRVPNGSIVVDGRLDEGEWQSANPATDFVQQQPREGAPATHRSEVRFLYDDDNLYVGGRFTEDEIDRLVVNELKRDFIARDGDLVVLNLDTFRDKLNAYNFQTNPACALRDSQSYDEGRNINANWDGVWTCRSSMEADGFVIEQAIPFKQLRFPRQADQEWGFNYFRLVRHSNEQATWTPVPRQFNQFKMSYAGVIDGISNVKPGRNIRIKPFGLGTLTRLNGTTGTSADGGIDAKIGIGTNLVFDATWRTDFSQVEVDTQQVNLTRYSLFFPEKREFFLENQGSFQIGGFTNTSNSFIPFFSRTIGLSDTGSPIPIVGGVRLTGRAGRNTIGILNMQTEEETRAGRPSLPAANFTAVRVSRDFLRNSSAGVYVLAKERGDVSNRIVGGEVRLNLKRSLNIDGLFMVSDKTAVGTDAAWRAGMTYDPGKTATSFSYTYLGDQFRDDLGFIPRLAVDILTASVMRRMRPEWSSKTVREWRATLPYTLYLRDGIGIETQTIAPSITAEFHDASTAVLTFQHNEEYLSTPFRPQGMPPGYRIEPGRYLFELADLTYTGNNSKRIAPVAGVRGGGYFDGDRVGATGGARVRFNAHLATTASVSRDWIDAGGTSFGTTLASLRVDGAFSTRMFLSAFVQYNSTTKQVSSNIRYDFIHHPLSDLYVVYNDTRGTSGLLPPTRSLTVKVTHLLSF
jgi:Domain of unknown function (DUF5916)/Carbohydrate family 9 binding domain-like